MPCPLGHTIYMSSCQATPYAIPYLARQYHAMPARTYHIPCQARQAILYTMPCPPSHCINHAMPARPYHIPCYAFQAKPYTCQACQAIPYTMPYLIGHTKCHARQLLPYTMPCLQGYSIIPYHTPCHARKAIPYTMPCPSGHTIYHDIPSRP